MVLTPRVARRIALTLIAAAVTTLPALAQTKEEKKAQEAQQQALRTLIRAGDALHSGKLAGGGYTIKANAKDDPAPAAGESVDLAWRHNAFKAVQGKVYMPFTVSYPSGKNLPASIVLYVRVVPKGTPLPTKDRDKAQFEFEQLFTGDAVAPAAGKPLELTRRIVVSPGDHDVYVLAQAAPGPEPAKNNVMLPGVAKKFEISVPDLWNGGLTTSNILLIDKIEALKEPPTQETIVFKPYTFTGADMQLAADDEFKKTEELTVYFHVYNPVIEEKRPDITIEYEFLKKKGDAEFEPALTEDGKKLVYNPQKYNAQTLPPQWDAEAGFQIAPGFAIPLNLFPVGEYKINIKITDNKAQKTITRELEFKVAA
jgi:hypothetical protein